jgi:aerobic carbon-monoxide dehydrogenase medium subunit
MKPAPFEYRAPESVSEAVALLAEHGDDAHVLAGGQSLLPMMALRLARPSMLIDIGRLDELTGLGPNDGAGLRIGAAVTQRTVERSALVGEACPLLAQAIPLIAHPPIRTRGTIGGSLAHADPAAELPAVAAALDAEVVLRHSGGDRIVPIADFFDGYLTTACLPSELVVEVRFPAPAPRTGTAFVEISRRHGDFAIVACAAAVSFDETGRVIDGRIALAGVDMVPVRARSAEALLIGATPGPERWKAAAEEAKAGLHPSSDIHATGAYRRHIAGVLIARALSAASAAASEARMAG